MSAAALLGRGAAGTVRSAGCVPARSLAPTGTSRHRLVHASRAGAAVAAPAAELSVGAARRRLADARPFARARAIAGAAIGVRVAALALTAAAPRRRTTMHAARNHLAVARAAVGVASADLADLPRTALVVVGHAHGQGGAVTYRLRVEHALARAAITAGDADLALDPARLEQRAPARRAGLSAAFAVAAAGLPRGLAWRRRGSAFAAHAQVAAAICTALTGAACRLALGALATRATVASGAAAHAGQRAALPGHAACHPHSLAADLPASIRVGDDGRVRGTRLAAATVDERRIELHICRRVADGGVEARVPRRSRLQHVELHGRAAADGPGESRTSRAKEKPHPSRIAAPSGPRLSARPPW